jgi:hypothetical protein
MSNQILEPLSNPSIQKIFRFNFSEEILEKLTYFSKIHKLDDRHSFKSAWKQWLIEHDSMVLIETKRLINLGYDGNIIEKMFFSVRYYLRKKKGPREEPKEKCKNISTNHILINEIDKHIMENIHNSDYKPATGFRAFCQNNLELYKNEATRLIQDYNMRESGSIHNKIKKTYKNRYYIIIRKNVRK